MSTGRRIGVQTVLMQNVRWINQSQPQTLQGAVMLLYFRGVVSVLSVLLGGGSLETLLMVAAGVGAVGIVNEKKWGYALAIVPSALIAVFSTLAFLQILGGRYFSASVISMMFAILLVVLLLHPLSRSYAKTWFK